MKVRKLNEIHYYPKQMVLIGQWQHNAVPANNEDAGSIRVDDPQGILETAEKNLKKLGPEQRSTDSGLKRYGRRKCLTELYDALGAELGNPGGTLETHWPANDGYTYKFDGEKELVSYSDWQRKVQKIEDDEQE